MSYMSSQPGKCGTYSPRNPEKYNGSYPIIMRSSWERILAQYCDNNPNVLMWSSEKIAIPYKHPYLKDSKGLPKTSRYYPDFIMTVKESENQIVKYIVEVKPSKQTRPPVKRDNRKPSTMLYEEKSWAVNSAKWKAAQRYCDKMGYKFKILTEKELIK